MKPTRREFGRNLGAASLAIAAPASWTSARAQSRPIRIGFSASQTGSLAAGVKGALVGYELWRDDVNAAGGVLGRPVELVTYDDQSNTATVPGIYSKLVDIDKVDVVFSPYGANLTATMMPFVKQRDLFCIGMFGISNNDIVKHDKFFQIAPWGPDASDQWARSFFDIAKANGFRKFAIVAGDAEFPKAAAQGGARIIKEYGFELALNLSYPPNLTDFSSILRNVKAAQPDVVFACTYPTESAAILRGVSEVGIGDSVELFGGGMVGLQFAAILESLGPALNGVVNFHTYVPEPTLKFKGIESFLARYEPIARQRGVDTLGHYLPPFFYAAGQAFAAAAEGAGSLDHAALGKWLHGNEIDTIVGRIRFDEIGNWTERRVLMVQFRGVTARNVEQFRGPGRQVVLEPAALRTGELVHPFARARA